MSSPIFRFPRHLLSRRFAGTGRLAIPALSLLLLAILSAGCEGADDGFLLSVEGRASVEGVAFLDLNRDGVRGAGETPLAGLRIAVVQTGSRDTLALVTSMEQGGFLARDLPAGTYQIAVPEGGVLGDSLQVTGIAPERVQLPVGGTAQVDVGVSFPVRTIRETLRAPMGTRSYVEGTVLNQRGSLPDNRVHVWDGDRAIRVLDVGTFPHAPGDTVRILGRVGLEEDRVVLTSGQGFRVGGSETAPSPLIVTSQEARAARGGGLDAALVRVENASVTDVRTADGTIVATADDGSGGVQIRIPQGHLTGAGLSVLEVGATLSVNGFLEPRAGAPGSWELRTRSGADLEVVAQGIIEGFTFFDRNGSGQVDAGDTALPNVRVRIFRTGDDTAPVAVVQSGNDGRFRTGTLDVRSYRLEVEAASLPDSLVVRQITPSPVTVSTGGVTQVEIAVSHPRVTSAEARTLPDGTTVFLHGIALNGRATLGDQTVHLRDPAGALRTLGLNQTVLPGDRVRMRGRVATVSGQRVLVDVTPFVESEGGVPAPVIVTTAQAATAGGGPLDADLVRMREVVIQSAGRVDENVAGRWLLVVSDGTGSVEVEVRLNAVGIPMEQAAEILAVGQRLNLNGLLIPFLAPPEDEDDEVDETGPTAGWRVHPRIPADLVLLDR